MTIFWQEFRKAIAISGIKNLELGIILTFVQNKINSNLGPKKYLSEVFGQEF